MLDNSKLNIMDIRRLSITAKADIETTDLVDGNLDGIKGQLAHYKNYKHEFFDIISVKALNKINELSAVAPRSEVASACKPVIENTSILLKSGDLNYEHAIEIYMAVLRIAQKPDDAERIQVLEGVAKKLSSPGTIKKILLNLYKAMGYLLMYVATESGKVQGKNMVAQANAVLNIKGTLFAAQQEVKKNPQSLKNETKLIVDGEEGLNSKP